MDDREIITPLTNRDERAAEALGKRFGGLCLSLIRNILRDPRDVEECLNGVYMRLWSSIPPAEPRNLTAYVAKAARNEALMRFRANRSRHISELDPLDELKACLPPAEDEVMARELARAVNGFLKDLPREKREVFIRRYWFFDPIADIARRYGFTEGKVTSMLFRLRAQLRDYLGKEGLLDG